MKGVEVENLFPEKELFYKSARYHIRNKIDSEMTDQEVFRLRKLVVKVTNK